MGIMTHPAEGHTCAEANARSMANHAGESLVCYDKEDSSPGSHRPDVLRENDMPKLEVL